MRVDYFHAIHRVVLFVSVAKATCAKLQFVLTMKRTASFCSILPFVMLALLLTSLSTAVCEDVAHSVMVINAKLDRVTLPDDKIVEVTKNHPSRLVKNDAFEIINYTTYKIEGRGETFRVNVWDMDVSSQVGMKTGSKTLVVHNMEIVSVSPTKNDIGVTFYDIFGVTNGGKPKGLCTAAYDRNQNGLQRLYQGTLKDIATGNIAGANNGAKTERRDDAGSDELIVTWNEVAKGFVTRVRGLLSREKDVASTTLQILSTDSRSLPSSK